MVTITRSKSGPLGVMSVTMNLQVDMPAVTAGLTREDGLIGQMVRRAAVTVKDRAIVLQSAPEYSTRTGQAQGRVGRWKTGQSTTQARISYAGSNQYASRATISFGSDYWRWQEFGTRYITPAPIFGRALLSLRPQDFL